MIQVNYRADGIIGIYREGMREVKKIPKKIIQQNLETTKFESKEIQQELKYFNGVLPMIRTIELGNRKQKRVDLYITIASFGRKMPEISILENYPLYNMLKKLIE